MATFEGVQKEIEENVQKVISNMQYAHNRNRNLRYFLCGDPNEEDLQKYWRNMVMVTASSPSSSLSSELLDEAIKNSPNLPDTYESTVNQLKELSNIQVKLERVQESLFNHSVSNTEMIFKNNPWMNDQFRFDFESTHKETALNYLRTNPEHKAMMSQNLIGISVYSKYLSNYRSKALDILSEMNELNSTPAFDQKKFIIQEQRSIAGTYKVFEYSPDSTEIKWQKGVHIIERDTLSGRLYSYTNRNSQNDSLYLENVKREIVYLDNNFYYFEFWEHFYAKMDPEENKDTLTYRNLCTDNPYIKVRIK